MRGSVRRAAEKVCRSLMSRSPLCFSSGLLCTETWGQARKWGQTGSTFARTFYWNEIRARAAAVHHTGATTGWVTSLGWFGRQECWQFQTNCNPGALVPSRAGKMIPDRGSSARNRCHDLYPPNHRQGLLCESFLPSNFTCVQSDGVPVVIKQFELRAALLSQMS